MTLILISIDPVHNLFILIEVIFVVAIKFLAVLLVRRVRVVLQPLINFLFALLKLHNQGLLLLGKGAIEKFSKFVQATVSFFLLALEELFG